MIEQVMKSNILHEASNLLKKQNKENKNEFDTSFKDLFLEKDFEYSKTNNDINTIVITFEDSQDYLEDQNNNISTNNEYIESSYYNKQEKLSDDSIQKSNQVDKNINKDQKNQELQNTELKNDKLKQDGILSKKESLETLNIKLKYRNIELKGDLDYKTRQKIKNILHDLKSGKISTNIANAFITQIIRTSHINGLKALNKNKKIKVELKKDEKGDKIKKLILNKKDSNINLEKDKNAVKNVDKEQNLNRFATLDNKDKSKDIKKLTINNNEQNKGEEVKLKDFKSEIKLDINDKGSNVAFNKDFTIDTKKALEINKQNLFQQIVKNTKVILAQKQTKFSTMIRPENFGRIDFHFVVKDGKLNGKVILQNQEVADFFKSNVEELKAVMQKSNVEMENIEIILAGNRFGEFAGNQQNNDQVSDDNFAFLNKITSKNLETFEENNSLEPINYSKRNNSKINILI